MTPWPVDPPHVFTLRLGARDGQRIPEVAVANEIRAAGADAFSLMVCEGWFRGVRDPGWSIMLAHDDHHWVARVAERLRIVFEQEGVGIEAFGRYLRCREDHGADQVAAELWGLRHALHPAYACTVFVIENEPAAWPDTFAIVTARVTADEAWTPEENAAAHIVLGAEVGRCGAWSLPMVGRSPDGKHVEPGWAVALTKEEACQLGRAYRQDAIYLVRGGVLRVVTCSDCREVVLGPFWPRLSTANTSESLC